MWPFLRCGEQVIVKAIPTQDLGVGDIILYVAQQQLVCHRLIRRGVINGKRGFYVRGDNSTSSPELIDEKSISGKVVAVVKNSAMIDLTRLRWRLMGRIIVIVAPLISQFTRIVKFILKVYE